LKTEDLAANGIDISKLPPRSISSLGSKRTIDKQDIKQFVSLKREAQAICSRYGVKFGDTGYAIPVDKTDEICALLRSVKARFAIEKDNFIKVYEQKTKEWIEAQLPEWQEAIRKSVDSVDRVSSVMKFNFVAFDVNPVASANGLDEEVGGLHGQLCKEIRQLATLTLKTSYAGKTEVGKKALRPLKAIKDKLNGMGFLDPEFTFRAADIDACIGTIEATKSYPIKGTNLIMLSGILTQLSNLGITATYVDEEPEEEIDEFSPEEIETTTEADVAAPAPPKLEWDF
jgi:hypothetical protein